MNKLTRLSICTFVLFSFGFISRIVAQPVTGIAVDSTQYRDSEIYEERDDNPTYSWIGGGFSLAYFKPDLTSFNTNIAQPFVHKDVASQVLMFGGQGFIPFPYIRNIRIGGMGYGGKTEQCCVPDTTTSGQSVTRSLKYSIGYGGLMVDYALPIHSDRFKFLVGTEIGLGGIDIEAKQAANRTKFDISADFDSPTNNITHTYSSSFILVKPRITFEYSPVNFMMFNLSAGYQVTAMGTWKVDGDVSLGDEASLKDVTGSGLVFNFGVNIGFFQ